MSIGCCNRPLRWSRSRLDKIGAGKAERFIGTLQREWAYARLFRSNPARLASLPRWLDTYNRRRPHAGLDGLTPLTVLVNKVAGNDT